MGKKQQQNPCNNICIELIWFERQKWIEWSFNKHMNRKTHSNAKMELKINKMFLIKLCNQVCDTWSVKENFQFFFVLRIDGRWKAMASW